ncbi:TadE/TadG family type IV pilus assembly protein [Magnetovibrio sp.]|uniref:TadE/TadG family type IV pilus assembly protein n=1 Tax=Magnetovibrio sp. TaxID=2024836 RepID=UPI002F92A1F6
MIDLPRPFKRFLNRFFRASDGAAAVEFALISPVLVFVFMAIMEVSVMFFASANIDGAAIDAARRIRTGQNQSSADPASDFSTALCGSLSSAINCGSLFHDVRTVTSFATIDLSTEIDPVTGEPITYGYSSGSASDIVVVRVMYYWDFVTPFIGRFLSDAGSNRRLLASTVVFQNEPYK